LRTDAGIGGEVESQWKRGGCLYVQDDGPTKSPVEGWVTAALILVATMHAGCPEAELDDRPDTGEGRVADSTPRSDAEGRRGCSLFPDDCGEGLNCYTDITERGPERVCLPLNPGRTLGDDCDSVDDCGDGARCYEGTCRAICNPDEPESAGCDGGGICLGMNSHGYDLAWGVCVPKNDACTMWPNDDCGTGKNCYRRSQGTRCLAYDESAALGDSCGGSTDCGDGQVCVEFDGRGGDTGAGGGRCYEKCNGDHPCASGECQATSELNYGACLADEM
jgi:hypothetical protein